MKKQTNNNNNDIQYLPMFMCFGISFGTVFGMVTGNQALGMSIGMCIGVCIGTLLDAQKKKKTSLKAIVFDQHFVEKTDQIVAENSNLFPGTKTVLKNLRERGYKTAIVTTKRSYQVNQILEKCDAMDLFDMIVGSDNVQAEKPDPKGLLKVLEEYNLKNEEVLYVGDSIVDAKTAENAGVRFAAVLTGTTGKEEHEKYKHEIITENLEELFRYIIDLEEEDYE